MRKRSSIGPALAFIVLCALFPIAHAAPVSAPVGNPSRPKLLVMIVIDQFRYDYLVRFRPWFRKRAGFNLLLQGANFLDCRYDYATTATCPGHASLFTGAYPNITGIVGNDWYDRSLNHLRNCVADPAVKSVGGSEDLGATPRNLMVSTLGDELHMATDFQSKVIGISLKDRGAIIPAGHTANAAYWYDARTGHFVSSVYYMDALPDWAVEFNNSLPAKSYCGKPWRALAETPGADGKVLEEFTPTPDEPCPDQRFLSWLDSTPAMNEIELKFASQAIRGERLGQGSNTDMLTISLSVNDFIGHKFGPYSPQVADVTLQTDRYLAAFFEDLDHTLGLDNVWIALSADHGVSPNPKYIRQHRLGAGNSQPALIRAGVEQGLAQAFGPGQWIEGFDEFCLFLNSEAIKAHGLDKGRVEAVAAQAAMSVPGVQAAFTRTQFMTGALPLSPLARKAANSFNSQRSGDVFLILDPYAVPVAGEVNTTHGSPWNYDAQIPMVFWGAAFRPGDYAVPCQPIDLAPTIASALRLTMPSGAQGKPLSVALKQNWERAPTPYPDRPSLPNENLKPLSTVNPYPLPPTLYILTFTL